jgi:hypothetical protein
MDKDELRREIAQAIRGILRLVNDGEDPADVLANEIVESTVPHVEVVTDT